MGNDELRIANIVNMENPQRVFEEVKIIVRLIFPDFEFGKLEKMFKDVVKLFEGKYSGYKKSNTEYHDLQHTTDVAMAMTRLIHAGTLQKKSFSQKNVALGIISSIFHDTGYIQTIDDKSGTGAKYTLTHIQRSIDFLEIYLKEANGNYTQEDFENCRDMLNCTGLNTKTKEIAFKSKEIELLGKMLGAADLLGQMADRTYLEKLLFLFHEFEEGKVPGFKSELDLLKKTLVFYTIAEKRFAEEFDKVNECMIHHFKIRWKIEKDLYKKAIKRNIAYLEHVLEKYENEYREHLRRGDYVKKLKKKGL